MTYTLILIFSLGEVSQPGFTEAECQWAVKQAPAAAARYGPDTRLISARCERET